MFNLFDDDQSGRISLKNLKRVAKELGETMTGVWLHAHRCASRQIAIDSCVHSQRRS